MLAAQDLMQHTAIGTARLGLRMLEAKNSQKRRVALACYGHEGRDAISKGGKCCVIQAVSEQVRSTWQIEFRTLA